jgi:uncharacterized membrane protein
MAQRTVVLLEDDLDGGQAAETVTFALDGTQYEIDLSDQNAQSLRDALDRFVANARRIGGRSTRGRRSSQRDGSRKVDGPVDNAAVRAWAKANKVDVNARGRIPASVISAYREAGN